MNRQRRSSDAGFSLIELLVAMTITLIVSGAIYGLLAGGQNAFRREPELTERQQNIRLAMDMIMRDASAAGAGLPPLMEVFTTGLNAAAGAPPSPSGVASDELEIITSAGRDSETACAPAWGASTSSSVFLTRQAVPPFGENRLAFLVFSSSASPGRAIDDRWTARRLTAQSAVGAPAIYGTPTGAVPPDCTAGSPHTLLTFAPGDTPAAMNPAAGVGLCGQSLQPPFGNVTAATCSAYQLTRVAFGSQVRYRIRTDADGVPVLQRASTDDPSGAFQVVARGIEELQVQYSAVGPPGTPGPWVDGAPTVATPALAPAVNLDSDFATLVGQVRVTMSARAEATRMAGAVAAPGDPVPRLRGSLTSTTSPRAVLMHLARARPSPVPSPGIWYWE